MELPECCAEENLSLLLNVSLEERDLRGFFLFWGFATSGPPGPVPRTHRAGRAPKALHLNLGFAADESLSSNSSSLSQGCGDTQQWIAQGESWENIAEDGEAGSERCEG